MPVYQPVPDPFVGKNPLPTGAFNFYEREEEFVAVHNLLRVGESVSLVGERKAGKTSFLNYLLARLPSDGFIPVFIDLQLVNPKTDQTFLGELVEQAAEAIAEKIGLGQAIKINTFTAQPPAIYRTFRSDLDHLRAKLPLKPGGEKKQRLVWLIDEIDVLRSYQETELFTFLRPFAQVDPNFRFVVAGQDVLDTLSSWSEWSPFFNAFSQPIRLRGLNPFTARQLINDALTTMQATIEESLYPSLFNWTGQKPFFLKWSLSKTTEVLNQRQKDHFVDVEIWRATKEQFLDETAIYQHFNNLWGQPGDSQPKGKPTDRQRTVLSLIATQPGPYNYPTVLNDLKDKKLIGGDKQAEQHLIEDLKRLEQLGFLYPQVGEYIFSSECLQEWIKKHKPL